MGANNDHECFPSFTFARAVLSLSFLMSKEDFFRNEFEVPSILKLAELKQLGKVSKYKAFNIS